MYLQTWHGTPLKHIHFDVLWAPPGRLDYLHPGRRRWDHLLSPNPPAPGPCGAFGFHGRVARDRLSAQRRPVSARRARRAPRARPRAARHPRGQDGRPLHPDLARRPRRRRRRAGLRSCTWTWTSSPTASATTTSCCCACTTWSPVGSGRSDQPGVHDVSFHPDISDLYLAADVMVTDYSSTMFDFAVTGKPMLFSPTTSPHYRRRAARLLLRHRGGAPGPLVRTTQPARRMRSLDLERCSAVRRVVRAVPQPVLPPRGRPGNPAGRGLAAGSGRHRRAGPRRGGRHRSRGLTADETGSAVREGSPPQDRSDVGRTRLAI